MNRKIIFLSGMTIAAVPYFVPQVILEINKQLHSVASGIVSVQGSATSRVQLSASYIEQALATNTVL